MTMKFNVSFSVSILPSGTDCRTCIIQMVAHGNFLFSSGVYKRLSNGHTLGILISKPSIVTKPSELRLFSSCYCTCTCSNFSKHSVIGLNESLECVFFLLALMCSVIQ